MTGSVNGGTICEDSSGNYEAGTQISIQACESPGYRFDRWTTSEGGSFADAMPDSTPHCLHLSSQHTAAQLLQNLLFPTGHLHLGHAQPLGYLGLGHLPVVAAVDQLAVAFGQAAQQLLQRQ